MTRTATFGHIRCNPKTVISTRPRRKASGHRGFMAKIDEPTVRKIRAEAKHWPQRVLARRYGLAMRTIHEIVNRLTWVHVA